MLRAVRWLLVVVVVLVIGATTWVGVRGALAYRHLRRIEVAAPELQRALTTGDTTHATVLGGRIRADAAAADRLTGDPVWRLATRLPRVGADLAAIHTVARGVDGLAAGALTPLIRIAATVAARPAGAHPLAADLTLLDNACGDLRTTSASVATVDATLRGISTAGLTHQITEAVDTLRFRTTRGMAALATTTRVCTVLPVMVDSPTPKSYLLLFQNLAEARSLGGIVGAYAVVRADHGALTLTATGAGADIKVFPRPVVALDPAYSVLFADQPGRYFLDTTTTPYFPDAALLAREMWRRHSGQTVDGVLSVDPVALSYLLAVTGPVRVPGGPTVTSANASRLLQNDVYFRYPSPAVQNEVFARTTVAVFEAVSSFRGSPRALATALARGAGEHRLLVWSADPALARSLAGSAVGGVPAVRTNGPGTTGGASNVGVYLDNGTASKLSWYLGREVSLHAGASDGGYRSVTVSLRLTSTAPAGGLPSYISGDSRRDTDRVIVLILAPAGGSVVSATVSGRPTVLGSATLHDRSAVSFGVDVPAGRGVTASVTLLVTEIPGLDLQPLAR